MKSQRIKIAKVQLCTNFDQKARIAFWKWNGFGVQKNTLYTYPYEGLHVQARAGSLSECATRRICNFWCENTLEECNRVSGRRSTCDELATDWILWIQNTIWWQCLKDWLVKSLISGYPKTEKTCLLLRAWQAEENWRAFKSPVTHLTHLQSTNGIL